MSGVPSEQKPEIAMDDKKAKRMADRAARKEAASAAGLISNNPQDGELDHATTSGTFVTDDSYEISAEPPSNETESDAAYYQKIGSHLSASRVASKELDGISERSAKVAAMLEQAQRAIAEADSLANEFGEFDA